MYREINKLLLYRTDRPSQSSLEPAAGGNSGGWLLACMGELFRRWEVDKAPEYELIYDMNFLIKSLLDLSTQYGFDGNLWHCYLTYYILSCENSFSLTCEGTGVAGAGSVRELAKRDFKTFKNLFDFDFGSIERALGTDCFTTVCNYRAIPKRAALYNRSVSSAVCDMSRRISAAKDENEIFDLVTAFYRDRGVGDLGFNRAFRISGSGENLKLMPINNIENVSLSDLVGYEIQKRQLMDNTEAFIAGKRANNVLLYGDAGTGKSTSVKALLNDYFDSGLRMIEIYKHQFRDLSSVIARIKRRSYRFIIFIDDLSFEEHEIEYKFLKAVIEGGVETRPDNILIYATSNRRHLIKETWNDKNDMEHIGDIHRSDTVEEKLSLASRFGVAINYSAPNRSQYHNIVKALAEREGIDVGEEELLAMANTWERRHGGVSGRTAQQFVNDLAGKSKENPVKKG